MPCASGLHSASLIMFPFDRLFTTVRDTLGLTYDVSFELSLLDRLKFGWFVISVTSTPAKVCSICLYIMKLLFTLFSRVVHIPTPDIITLYVIIGGGFM